MRCSYCKYGRLKSGAECGKCKGAGVIMGAIKFPFLKAMLPVKIRIDETREVILCKSADDLPPGEEFTVIQTRVKC